MRKYEKHISGHANTNNTLTDAVVKDAVLKSHHNTAPMLFYTIAIIIYIMLSTELFSGDFAVFLIVIAISFCLIGAVLGAIGKANAVKGLGKTWYKAEIIPGEFEKVEFYEDDEGDMHYSVSFSARTSPVFLHTPIDASTYSLFVTQYDRGDEIYVLRYRLYGNEGYGYIAYCPHNFQNTSSFNVPSLQPRKRDRNNT